MLLAQGLQRVQSTLDITDLCGQCVYGLHGAIQLLAAGHQSVHALWEPKHKACKRKMQPNEVNAIMAKQDYKVLHSAACCVL